MTTQHEAISALLGLPASTLSELGRAISHGTLRHGHSPQSLLPLGKIMPVGWDGDMLNKHIELMGRSDERYNTVEIPENTVHRIVTTTRRNAVKK